MRNRYLTETWLVLAVSLGASAIYAVLRIINRLTVGTPLGSQTSALNSSVTPDRPWLDLAYQLVAVGLGVAPALLAVFLLTGDDPRARFHLGLDLSRPGRDLLHGLALAAIIGIPGLGLYLAARELGFNTTVAAANLSGAWWTIPVLILAAIQNAVLEEVVMIGYLFRRWEQAGWGYRRIAITSAVIRGTYHLYQGFGGFVGNIAMGLILGYDYKRHHRVAPLIVAHATLDIVAFIGYTLLAERVGWL